MSKYRSKRKAHEQENVAPEGIADNVYEVESILFDELHGNKIMYLVKWKNYPMDQCTWEPYRNLNNCTEVLAEYCSTRIVSSEIYTSESFKKLLNHLNSFAEQELIESLHNVVDEGIPTIEEKFIHGTVAYLSTVAPSHRSQSLINLVRHNLMLIEVKKRRNKQHEKLEKWQCEMNLVCGFKLSVVNNVDFEGPPKKFMYVNECVAGEGVVIPNDPPAWCQCTEMCGKIKRNRKNCHFSDSQLPYNKHKRIIVPRGTPIFECNRKCHCDNSCINRVIQLGPLNTLKLQIFRTNDNRGWGVKTLVPIKQGSYVTKYTGEVITRLEAEKRAITHGSKSTYMFDLDYNTDKNDCVYSVDATLYGNVSHFINHSCDANLSIYAAWIDCLDPDLPTLALFASRHIAVGEEITFNYMTSVTNGNRRIKCKCRSENCQGYLC